MWKSLLRIAIVLLPWPARRRILVKFWKYEIDPTSRIGVAWVFPNRLEMGPYSAIGHLTVCKNLENLCLRERATIGRLNWITGHPKGSTHFQLEADRTSNLIVGEHAAVTSRHILDCTNAIQIGRFSTVAGFRSVILTHSVDLVEARQKSHPVSIGAYCFLGTNCVVLGGSVLPDFSVLAAHSLLRDEFTERYTLYGGTPARKVRSLSPEARYFSRSQGFVI